MSEEKESLNDEQKAIISEIDKRIEELKAHRKTWGRAGGVGGKMAMDSLIEIQNLLDKRDIIANNPNYREYVSKDKELQQLKALREEAMFLLKPYFAFKIKQAAHELQEIKTRKY